MNWIDQKPHIRLSGEAREFDFKGVQRRGARACIHLGFQLRKPQLRQANPFLLTKFKDLIHAIPHVVKSFSGLGIGAESPMKRGQI